MYGVKVGDVLEINNMMSLACERVGNGSFEIGARLTDGEITCVVTGIPFVRYKSVEAMRKNICLLVDPKGVDAKALIGKTLLVADADSPYTATAVI